MKIPPKLLSEKSKKKPDIAPIAGKKLGQFILAPGYCDEIIYAFLAQDLEKLETPPEQDDDEDIDPVLMTPEELEQAILDGEPVDAKNYF
jgi:hypothetical protein